MSYHPDDVRAFRALIKTVDRRLLTRAGARLVGNYAEADAIRAELEEDGWTVEDTPNGVMIYVKGTNLLWHRITDPKTLVEEATWHEGN